MKYFYQRGATAAVALIITLTGGYATAQNYPAKPVTIYVGFPAGSTNDSTARAMAHQLTEQMGQQFVVMNRDGAAGVVAATAFAKMKGDGYALMWASASPLVMSPAYNRNLAYDPLKDFAPVSVYFYIPYVTVIHPSVPAKNLRELIALAKTQPGKLSFGSSGVGGALHLATELILNMSGTRMLHVPYRGTPPMTLDLIAGQIDLVTTSTSMAAPHIQSGRLRPIGVTSSKRSVQLPDVPTIAEAGVPGYEVDGWYGLATTAGTPKPVVERLNAAVNRALPELRERYAGIGADIAGGSSAEFSAYLKSELEKWARVVKQSGAKVE